MICMTDIGIEISERITAIGVCPEGKWVSVATELSGKLTNIVLFQIRRNKFLDWQDEINYYFDDGPGGVTSREYNWVRDIDISLKVNNQLVITAFMFAGGRQMLPFGIEISKVNQ